MSVEFWEKWYKAGELEKVELIKTLTLPSPRLRSHDYEHHCAVLMNSYLVDLVEYLQGIVAAPLVQQPITGERKENG